MSTHDNDTNKARAADMVADHHRLHGGFDRADSRRVDTMTAEQERDLGRAVDRERVDQRAPDRGVYDRPASPQEGRVSQDPQIERQDPAGRPGSGELRQVVRGIKP